MGIHNSSSARNLNSYRSGSRNGSEGVRDSLNLGGAAQPSPRAGYNPPAGASKYVRGACYNVQPQQEN